MQFGYHQIYAGGIATWREDVCVKNTYYTILYVELFKQATQETRCRSKMKENVADYFADYFAYKQYVRVHKVFWRFFHAFNVAILLISSKRSLVLPLVLCILECIDSFILTPMFINPQELVFLLF